MNAVAQQEILNDAFVNAKVAEFSSHVLFKHLGLHAVVKVLSSISPLVMKRLGSTLQSFAPTGNVWEL